MHVDTDRITVLLYVILKHFKIQSEEALFPVICEIWYDDTIQKKPPPTGPWKHSPERRLVSYRFLHHTWTKLSPDSLCLWDFTESKKCWLGQTSAQSAAKMGTIANRRSSRPWPWTNESQNLLRMEIKPLLWATSSNAALPLQIEVPPFNPKLQFVPLHLSCCHLPSLKKDQL